MKPQSPEGGGSLLAPGFLARLERFRIASKRLLSGKSTGERRSRALGSSVEFADHRQYHLGDDPRYLDWNVYARLEKLFIKLFCQESDIAVHLILDASASMGCGDASKFLLARRLTAGLAYVTLANYDRAALLSLGGEPPAMRMPARGKGNVHRILELLEGLKPAGRPDPVRELKRYAALQKRPGVVIVLSDLLDERFRDALRVLTHHRHELWCLHLLSPADRGEDLAGDLELEDVETRKRREISAVPAVLDAYRKTVADFRESTQNWCLEQAMGYQYMDSKADFEDILMSVLRKKRLVQ